MAETWIKPDINLEDVEIVETIYGTDHEYWPAFVVLRVECALEPHAHIGELAWGQDKDTLFLGQILSVTHTPNTAGLMRTSLDLNCSQRSWTQP